MVTRGEVDRAMEYLQKIPSESPRRGTAELATGRALWNAFLQREQAGQSPDDLAELKLRAQTTLADGIQRMKQLGKSPQLVQAALSLAQIYLATQQPDQALELLYDRQMGPAALVEGNDPLVETPGFPAAVVKTTLQAQLQKMTQSNDAAAALPDRALPDALTTMERLKQLRGDSPEGLRRLAQDYIALANDLQHQLALAPPARRAVLASVFEAVLNQVRSTSQELSVLNWVAETYFRLGEEFARSEAKASSMSQKYFAEAGATFGQIMSMASDGTLELDKRLEIQIRMRRASTMSRLGEFDQAIDEFEKVLIQKPMMLNVQIEAAQALTLGGQAGNTRMLNEAIKGTRKNNNTAKNTIWGWERIALLLQAQMTKNPENREKYQESYFTAEYNLVECRYQQAPAR